MNASARLPADVQGLLETIYDVSVLWDVGDFLITDRQQARVLQGGLPDRDVDEKLLVSQDGDYVDVSLFLDPEVLQRLYSADPLTSLHHRNLSDFWLVVEGISHFVYLAWNARHDKSVTLLEMEMQAEVDKFVAAAHLFGSQGAADVADELHRWLFEYVRFDSSLCDIQLERYRHASRYAGKYCKTLYGRFLRHFGNPALLTELRRFYRLPQSAKIRHIDATFSAARQGAII